MLNGEELSYEASLDTLTGETRWYHVRIRSIKSGDNKTHGICLETEDVTERKRTKLMEEKIVNDLVEHNRNLEQFAYIVSHNLRAPVASILGLASIVNDLRGSEQEEALKGLVTAARGLDRVLHDLNDILSITSDVDQRKDLVVLPDLLEEVKLGLAEQIRAANVTVTSVFNGVDAVLTIKSYLISIFHNLVSNGIKYRQPNIPPVITVTGKVVDDVSVITIKDNGIGIDIARHHKDIFGLYKRFHTHIPGRGVGLFMVKNQVEAIGGRITVDSQPGQGTEFQLYLPLTN